MVILFGLLCGALFTGIVGTLGANFVWLMGTDQTSPDLEVPMWIVYLCIPLGSYLMCFRFLQVAYGFCRTGELPHHDPGHVEGLSRRPSQQRCRYGPPPAPPRRPSGTRRRAARTAIFSSLSQSPWWRLALPPNRGWSISGPMNAALIFGLLVALMLTGMPISIALGLTVLTFLFTMTQVPIEAVG